MVKSVTKETLDLLADRIGLHGTLRIPALNVERALSSEQIDREQAAALTGIGALPPGLQVGDTFTMLSVEPAMSAPLPHANHPHLGSDQPGNPGSFS